MRKEKPVLYSMVEFALLSSILVFLQQSGMWGSPGLAPVVLGGWRFFTVANGGEFVAMGGQMKLQQLPVNNCTVAPLLENWSIIPKDWKSKRLVWLWGDAGGMRRPWRSAGGMRIPTALSIWPWFVQVGLANIPIYLFKTGGSRHFSTRATLPILQISVDWKKVLYVNK